MQTGWEWIDEAWYYLTSSGAMQTGWLHTGSQWYYLSSGGSMVTGWQIIDGTYYYFKSSGTMAANEWCSGYWLGEDGAWTYTPEKAEWYQTISGIWWYGDGSGWYAKDGEVTIDGITYTFNEYGYLKAPANTKRIFLSPSNQDDNTFITGNANEGDVWNDIAARLLNLLTEYNCEVIIADYDMRLENRAEEAKQWEADVYIAMHSNAYSRPNAARGVEVYYDASKSDSAEREALAQAFLDELSTLFYNRGLRTASYLKDCRLPEMPSVIVECGYHDTVSDANLILNNKDEIAQLYCNALVQYLGLVKTSE